jgi:hypothetical protein
MAQCDLCRADDDNITKEMLKNEGIEDTDDYFLSWREITVCKDCYYKRDEWDNDDIDTVYDFYCKKQNNEERTTK